jgi:hypothetical protein
MLQFRKLATQGTSIYFYGRPPFHRQGSPVGKRTPVSWHREVRGGAQICVYLRRLRIRAVGRGYVAAKALMSCTVIRRTYRSISRKESSIERNTEDARGLQTPRMRRS